MTIAASLAAPNDRGLVDRFLRSREEAAFRALYDVHAPYLWKLGLRLCGGREGDAEEIVQDTWLRVSTRLERFSWNSALRTWMAGILINCWREQRKRHRFAEELPQELADDVEFPDCVNRVDLERAIAGLSEGSRAVLVLYEIEGYSHDEIGRLLGIPAGTSKSRLFHARRAIHDCLTSRGAVS